MSANLFAVEAMTYLTSVLVDRGKTDIRIEAAMAKMFGTEAAWDVGYEAQQVIGGRGYETAYSLKERGDYPYPIERIVRDLRINTIFEGSSEIMRLFLAREAMDPHLKAAGKAVNASLPMGQRLGAALKASGFYVFWYPKMWLPSVGPSTSRMDGRLASQVRYVKKTARKLARRMFHAMLKHGPKIEQEQIQKNIKEEQAKQPPLMKEGEAIRAQQDEKNKRLQELKDELARLQGGGGGGKGPPPQVDWEGTSAAIIGECRKKVLEKNDENSEAYKKLFTEQEENEKEIEKLDKTISEAKKKVLKKRDEQDKKRKEIRDSERNIRFAKKELAAAKKAVAEDKDKEKKRPDKTGAIQGKINSLNKKISGARSKIDQ